eukprot:6189197-Pleurochrysis_carterae.AAC.2
MSPISPHVFPVMGGVLALARSCCFDLRTSRSIAYDLPVLVFTAATARIYFARAISRTGFRQSKKADLLSDCNFNLRRSLCISSDLGIYLLSGPHDGRQCRWSSLFYAAVFQ